MVLDHCPYINKFLGWTHNECNVNINTTNYIPVVAHNLTIFESDFIIKALTKIDSQNNFSVIPASETKYISLIISIYIKNVHGQKRKNEKKTLQELEIHRFV